MSRVDLTRYYETQRYLESLSPSLGITSYLRDKEKAGLYLKRVRYLLNLVGNPDHGRKFIHITGTSGKGSVSTMVHTMLANSRRQAGLFTSPFCTSAIEKIKVGGKYISPEEFCDIVDYLKPFIDKTYIDSPYGLPSYFELFLVIALIYFQRLDCEWVVLEVGLGGRFDATNVITDPVVTAVTNIGYDHTAILGNQLSLIAQEKAGIIKAGSEFFTTETNPRLIKLFHQVCHEVEAEFNLVATEANDYKDKNMALAEAIGNFIGIETAAISSATGNFQLPCRFEIMQKNPWIILDGAHNPDKVRSTIKNLQSLNYTKLHLIVGFVDGKDYSAMIKELTPLADTIIATRLNHGERVCVSPKKIAQIASRHKKPGAKIEIMLDPFQALATATGSAKPSDAILAVGSFLLAGDLRKNWYPESMILEKRQSF